VITFHYHYSAVMKKLLATKFFVVRKSAAVA
jgi:hypothetical protein